MEGVIAVEHVHNLKCYKVYKSHAKTNYRSENIEIRKNGWCRNWLKYIRNTSPGERAGGRRERKWGGGGGFEETGNKRERLI